MKTPLSALQQFASFLGEKLQCSSNSDLQGEIAKRLKKTLWLTYRGRFSQLCYLKDNQVINSKITSDSGWGCMLRVGQNAFAEILKRHLLMNNSINVVPN